MMSSFFTASKSSKAAVPSDPLQPLLVKTITYRTAPVQAAAMAPMPALVPGAAPAQTPTPAPAAPDAPKPDEKPAAPGPWGSPK